MIGVVKDNEETRQEDKDIPISKIIPNMITSGSVFCGVASLIMTYHGHIAGILYALRYFRCNGRKSGQKPPEAAAFPEELDNLADAISFGVAPAFLIYAAYIGKKEYGVRGIIILALCGVLRLARFNVMHVPAGPFQGLPIPAGGHTWLRLSSRRSRLRRWQRRDNFFVGGLMVKPVPYATPRK